MKTNRQPTISFSEHLNNRILAAERSIEQLSTAIAGAFTDTEPVEDAVRATMTKIGVPSPANCATRKEKIVCLWAIQNTCENLVRRVEDGRLTLVSGQVMFNGMEPQDINAMPFLVRGFDERQAEIAAEWIVRFCQARGARWEPFARSDIEQYVIKHGYRFQVSSLASAKNGVVECDEWLYIDSSFIMRCWLASYD